MPTYKDIIEYLDSFANYERTGLEPMKKGFDLDKLRAILKKAGDPHEDYYSVHVAGTKGKGSVCSFVSFVLEEAGHKVGLFTSPHLDTVRERIKINNRSIGEEDFAQVADLLRGYISSGPAKEDVTFFEFLTLMAMVYFSKEKVDYAVFEVGMGGRYDATNVLNAKICAISPVSRDHTYVLGDTLEKIAREKAAIIKKDTHCVSAPQPSEALSAVKTRCEKEGASLSLVGEDIKFKLIDADEKGSTFDIDTGNTGYLRCRTSLPGEFQALNCATAAGILEKIHSDGGNINKETLKKGVSRAFLPGRLEVLTRDPAVVIDGAQNEESAERLAASVQKIFRYNKLLMVLGLSKDKDIEGVCRKLVPIADGVILTRARAKRAADPLIIRGYVKDKNVLVTRDTKEALGAALGRAGKRDMILATGSFFVIGEIRKMLLGK